MLQQLLVSVQKLIMCDAASYTVDVEAYTVVEAAYMFLQVC